MHCVHTDSIVRMLKFKFIKIKTKVIFIFFKSPERKELVWRKSKCLREFFEVEASASLQLRQEVYLITELHVYKI